MTIIKPRVFKRRLRGMCARLDNKNYFQSHANQNAPGGCSKPLRKVLEHLPRAMHFYEAYGTQES